MSSPALKNESSLLPKHILPPALNPHLLSKTSRVYIFQETVWILLKIRTKYKIMCTSWINTRGIKASTSRDKSLLSFKADMFIVFSCYFSLVAQCLQLTFPFQCVLRPCDWERGSCTQIDCSYCSLMSSLFLPRVLWEPWAFSRQKLLCIQQRTHGFNSRHKCSKQNIFELSLSLWRSFLVVVSGPVPQAPSQKYSLCPSPTLSVLKQSCGESRAIKRHTPHC